MAAGSITSSAARIAGIFDVSNLAQAAIPEGAVVAYQTALTDDNDALLPTGANAIGLSGVSMGAGTVPAGTATSGSDYIAVQKHGRAKVLLKASTTCTKGQLAVVANASGHVVPRTQFTTSAQVVGYFAQDHTSGTSPEYVMVDLFFHNVEICQSVFGAASTAIGAATRYLSSAGTGASSATAVVLEVVPFAGVLRNFFASAVTAPGGADTGIFTVYKSSDNGATFTATTLTCTISAAGKSANDITHFPAVAAGDLLAIQVVSTAGTLAGCSASFQLT